MKAVTTVTRTPEIEEEVYDTVCPILGRLLTGRKFTLASTYAGTHDRIWENEH